MNQVALDYLLRLAALAMTFVGFATIVVTLRRALGADLSPFDLLLVRYYIENGLLVTVGALLPSLVTMFGLPASSTWRFCCAVVGLVAPAFLVVYVRRLRRIQPGPLPHRIYARYAITVVVCVGLWLNVLGPGFEPNGAPYALALTWFLASAGIVFLQTIDGVLGRTPKS
jgi:hypothetical protein